MIDYRDRDIPVIFLCIICGHIEDYGCYLFLIIIFAQSVPIIQLE